MQDQLLNADRLGRDAHQHTTENTPEIQGGPGGQPCGTRNPECPVKPPSIPRCLSDLLNYTCALCKLHLGGIFASGAMTPAHNKWLSLDDLPKQMLLRFARSRENSSMQHQTLECHEPERRNESMYTLQGAQTRLSGGSRGQSPACSRSSRCSDHFNIKTLLICSQHTSWGQCSLAGCLLSICRSGNSGSLLPAIGPVYRFFSNAPKAHWPRVALVQVIRKFPSNRDRLASVFERGSMTMGTGIGLYSQVGKGETREAPGNSFFQRDKSATLSQVYSPHPGKIRK